MTTQPGSAGRSRDRWPTESGRGATSRGNAPRSVLRGPGSSNVDLSAAKNFTVTERVKTEFRGEFFNVFNFANFDIPGHTLGNSDFGIINSAKPARIVELALRVIF